MMSYIQLYLSFSQSTKNDLFDDPLTALGLTALTFVIVVDKVKDRKVMYCSIPTMLLCMSARKKY